VADDISKPTDRADAPRGAGYVIKELIRVIVGLVFVALIIAGGYWLVGPNQGKAPESQPAATAEATGGQMAAGPGKEAASADTGKTADQAQTATPPAPAPAAPATTQAPAPAQTEAAAPPPASAAPAAPSPAVAAASVPPAAPSSPASALVSPAGVAVVQLAAVPSEASARREWQRLQKRVPDLLGSRQPDITKVERAGHSSWLLRTSGFDDAAQAKQFCGHLHAKGFACSVAAE
jgi:cytoskeletal protein RodZ